MEYKTIKMKIFLFMIGFSLLNLFSFAQNADISYTKAMAAYSSHDYVTAAREFHKMDEQVMYKLSNTAIYDGACIFALNNEKDYALKLLNYLANTKYYSNFKQLSTDDDLTSLRTYPEWQPLMDRVQQNLKSLPQRTLVKVKTELSKAKSILLNDNGKLWGELLWSSNIIVLGPDNMVYTTVPLTGSITDDSIIFRKKIEDGILSQTNSVQKFGGKQYAVILTRYLNDSSSTIIHELFHVLQYSHINLSGNPVNYLDEYDARKWLCLEFEALRNALKAADSNNRKRTILFLNDALLYRKLRQGKYINQLNGELQIESSEGLANYTGFMLSTYPDKYLKAVQEIDDREKATSFTRSFAYATGSAYGMLFDYLNIPWKTGLTQVYNFIYIYEKKFLHKQIDTANNHLLQLANSRNNYVIIHQQERERKVKQERTVAYFKNLFLNSPTLSVIMSDSIYSRSYDMNGTIVLKDIGIVYPNIIGTDITGKNFGSFKAEFLGNSEILTGVLGDFQSHKFTFSLPAKIEGNVISGNGYSIYLNDGWQVVKKDNYGNLEIVKK